MNSTKNFNNTYTKSIHLKHLLIIVLINFSVTLGTSQLALDFPSFSCPIVGDSVVCQPVTIFPYVPTGASNLMGGDSITGPGHKMFWHGNKCAVRAGILDGSSGAFWNEDSLGLASASFGRNTRAMGDQSFATGFRSIASGDQSVAMGYQNEAYGTASVALGFTSTSSGNRTITIGQTSEATATDAIAIGTFSNATGTSSISIGQDIQASAENSMVIGTGWQASSSSYLVNNIANSLMIGMKTRIPSIFVGPAAGPNSIGRVGIGNSNPQQALDVSGAIKIGDTSTSTQGSIRYRNGKFEGNTSSGWVDFAGGGGSSVFSTNNNDAYYLDGNVGIGTSTPGTALEVNGDVTITGSIIGPSDRRLKTDIKELNNGLDIIKALSPKAYHYKTDTDFNLSQRAQYGLIAQEVKKILPSIVIEKALTDAEGTSYQGLVYQQLIPILVNAIQEIDEDNEDMRDKIEKRIQRIEDKLNGE